jgi:hypothetical protein
MSFKGVSPAIRVSVAGNDTVRQRIAHQLSKTERVN